MTNKIILQAQFLIVLLSFTHAVVAQQQKAPRKVVVINADVTLDARDEGFEVVIPGAPEKFLKKGDPSIEKPDEIEYDLWNGKDLYSIRYANYDFVVTDPIKLKAFYDLVKQTYFESGKREGLTPTFVSERDVYLDNKLGREQMITVNKRAVWFRSFLIQQSFYQLFFSTPLEGKTLEKVVKEKGKIVTKFLDSFKITKMPPPLNTSPGKQ